MHQEHTLLEKPSFVQFVLMANSVHQQLLPQRQTVLLEHSLLVVKNAVLHVPVDGSALIEMELEMLNVPQEATLLAIKQVVLLALQEKLAQTQIPMKLLLVHQGNIQLDFKHLVPCAHLAMNAPAQHLIRR